MFNQQFNFQIEKENKVFRETKLSIYLHSKGFTFSLFDDKNNLLQLADYNVHFSDKLSDIMALVKNIFSGIGITSFTYPCINVIFESNKQVWVPEVLYDKDHAQKYLKFVCNVDIKEQIHTYYSKELKAYSVFAINQNLYSAFKVLMPFANFTSQHSVLVEKGFNFSNESCNSVVLNIREKAIDILAYNKTDFIFSNNFIFEDSTEIIYFLLNVLKQLQFNASNTNCYICGTFDNTLLFRLQTFVPNFMYSSVALEELDNTALAKYLLVL